MKEVNRWYAKTRKVIDWCSEGKGLLCGTGAGKKGPTQTLLKKRKGGPRGGGTHFPDP